MRAADGAGILVVATLSVVGLRAAAQSPPPVAAASAMAPAPQQSDNEAPSPRRAESKRNQNAHQAPPLLPPDWQSGQPIPDGFHPVLASRQNLLALGVATLAISYSVSATAGLLGLVGSVGTADGEESTAGAKHDPPPPFLYLFVPVVGPFVAAKTDGCVAVCIVDGVVQTAGLGLIIFSLVARQPILVRNHLALSIAPARLSSNGDGITLFGLF